MAERELEKFQQQNCAVKLSMCKGAYNGNGILRYSSYCQPSSNKRSAGYFLVIDVPHAINPTLSVISKSCPVQWSWLLFKILTPLTV